MFSADMPGFFLFAVAPLLASAQLNQQFPLKEEGSQSAVPIALHGGRTYSFPTGDRRMDLGELQEFMNAGSQSTRPQIVSISIPLDSTQRGTMVFGHGALQNRPSPGLEWIDTLIPGVDMPMSHVGIRKGDMVTKDVYTARLALNTPYISLPGEIYDILIQATSPLPWQHNNGYDDVVDCDALGRFPELVLGLKQEMENEWEDEEVEDKEIVITPRQYILQAEEGRCILLVQRAYQHGTEGVILGWAAVRGRNLVLDWVNERTGFGR